MNRREMLQMAVGAGLAAVVVPGCVPPGPSPTPTQPGKSSAPPIGPNDVAVVHWGSDHTMNPALIPAFATEFNQANFTIANGKRIRILTYSRNSGIIKDELISRVNIGTARDGTLPNPTIVTPAADHWIGEVNLKANQMVVDTSQSQTLAATWIGIVTYKDMAECLGWPTTEIGFADIVALRADPQGWASKKGAKARWGKVPLISFTDPSRSSSARSMLYALYSIAANKKPNELTADDVTNPSVVEYIRQFQRGVDHYVPDTIVLNSMAWTGPTFGHFYFMVESNLVQLYKGKVQVLVDRKPVFQALPDTDSRKMVMIYPKEGSIAHNHSANIVRAPWVTNEQQEAAKRWISYLLEDRQQQAFVDMGFRPATAILSANKLGKQFGLNDDPPTRVLNPDTMKSDVMMRIVDSWEDVKKPGIAVFVVDTSGSMAGKKLDETKKGLILALEDMARNNSVGMVIFNDGIKKIVEVDKLNNNAFQLNAAVSNMTAGGGTQLYVAVRRAIEMVDSAPGAEESIRGVVIITDGQANGGAVELDDLVRMESPDEKEVPQCSGFETVKECPDIQGKQWLIKDIHGIDVKLQTQHTVKIFFVGVGDATVAPNWEVCRILSEGAHSECKESTADGLAEVIRAFSKYF